MPDTLNAKSVPLVLGILEAVVLQEVKKTSDHLRSLLLFTVCYWVPLCPGPCFRSLFPVPAMGLEHLMSPAKPTSGFTLYGNEAAEETKRLQGLRAETLMETCQSTESRDGMIRCPIPCKSSRWYRERELRAAQDLSDFILSKASPPYFVGSPPVRATNPLVHDAQFCAWKVQSVDQSLGIPIPTKGYNASYCARKGSFSKA